MIIGATWIDTDVYRVGEILENPSNCTSEETKDCRWIELDTSDNYYCDNYNKYSLEVEECTENGLIWTRTGESRKGATLIKEKSSDCGWNFVTTEMTDEIAFNYFGTDNLVYKVNDTTYTATSSPYSETLANLGITEYLYITQLAFENTQLFELLKFPSIDNVIYMNGMFYMCNNLYGLDLSGYTTTYARDMSNMFGYCESMKRLIISDFNTSRVKNMSGMFEGCKNLTDLDISHFDTSQVTDMSSMFFNCEKLTELDVSNFNTSACTNMSLMFDNCSGITSLDVSNFDTSNVTSFDSMFGVCLGLTELDLSNFNTSACTNMKYMFGGCNNLTSLNVTGWDVLQVTKYNEMFYNCTGLTEIILGEVSESEYDWWCERLTEAGISCDIMNYTIIRDDLEFEFTATTMTYKLNDTTYTATSSPYSTSISDLGIETLTSCYATFSGSSISNLISFPNTNNVTTMNAMFYNCNNLTDIDLSLLDTSNVINMDTMFAYCNGLTELDLSNFNTSAVTNMGGMFYYCSGLTSLDLSMFDTSNVTDMSSMFSNNSGLTDIDLSSFDTKQVNNMRYMFSRCKNLTSLDLSNFNTSAVTDMDYMFYDCRGLTSLDLSMFDTSQVTYMRNMFSRCYDLRTLDVSGWDVLQVSSGNCVNMFSGCTALRQILIYDATDDEYNWWCERLTEVGITCDILSRQPFEVPTDADLIFDFNAYENETYVMNDLLYYINGVEYPATMANSQYIDGIVFRHYVTLSDIGVDTVYSINYVGNSSAAIKEVIKEPEIYDPTTGETTDILSIEFSGSSITLLIGYDNRDGEYTLNGSPYSGSVTDWGYDNITAIRFSNTKVTKVHSIPTTIAYTDVKQMFGGCTSLVSANLDNMDLISTNSTYQMFNGSTSLETLSVKGWNTYSITSMNETFRNCSNLTTLDLSEWGGISLSSTTRMFSGCTSLEKLYVNNLDVNQIESGNCVNMFASCRSLSSISIKEGTYDWWCARLGEAGISCDIINYNNPSDTCTTSTTITYSSYQVTYDGGNVAYNEVGTPDVTATKTETTINEDCSESIVTSTTTITDYTVSYNPSGDNTTESNRTITCTVTHNGSEVGTFTYTQEGKPSDTGTTDTLSFEFTGDTMTYKLNGTTYTATTSPFSTTLSNLGIDTLTNCNQTFVGSSITKLTSFPNTSNVTHMGIMFNSCFNLTELDVSSFDTSNVTNMNGMFGNCSNLTNLDLISFNISAVTDMRYMFTNCSSLQTLNVSSWDVTHITSGNCVGMFEYCTSLTSLYIKEGTYDWWCERLTEVGISCDIIVGDSPTPDTCTSSTTYSNFKCVSITLDDDTVVTPTNDYYYLNKTVAWNEVYDGIVSVSYTKDKTVVNTDCTSATTTETFTTTNFTYVYSPSGNNETTEDREVFANMFENGMTYIGRIYYTQEGKPSDTGTTDELSFEFSGDTTTYKLNSTTYTATTSPYNTTLSDLGIDTLTSCYQTFSGSSISNLISFPDTSNVTDMRYMFWYCEGLTSLDLSLFNTSTVTDMTSMFSGSYNLTSLTVSNFNTTNVTSMNQMFSNCTGLTELDVSNFDTSNVTSMRQMFYNCSSLTELDVRNFNTSSCIDMESLFSYCSGLTSLNLSSFNTSNVTSMYYMFGRCSGLQSLDLSNFDTSNVTRMSQMFDGCNKLETLNVSSWDVNHITSYNNYSNMFRNCSSLKSLIVKSGTEDWWLARLTDVGIASNVTITSV